VGTIQDFARVKVKNSIVSRGTECDIVEIMYGSGKVGEMRLIYCLRGFAATRDFMVQVARKTFAVTNGSNIQVRGYTPLHC
jgi:hypothetical protein